MKALFSATLFLASVSAVAQQTPQPIAPTLSHFKVDGKRFFEVANCIPGSTVAFYSQTGGGKCLKALPANAEGVATFNTDKPFEPAFVLSVSNPADGGTAGNGMVTFVGSSLFDLTDVRLNGSVAQRSLQWSAAANADEAVVFEILASAGEAGDYLSIGTLAATPSAQALPYTFPLPNGAADGTTYRLRIRTDGKARYTTPPLRADGELSVWPTAAHENINLYLPGSDAAYTILDAAGKRVAYGVLRNGRAMVNVSALRAGSFAVVLHGTEPARYAARFVRL